jgi:hypothetical protein
MSIKNANCAEKNLSAINMQKKPAAQCPALPSFVGVKSVKKVENEDVYCLASKKNGNFVANGIVVKNCDALRYALYTHFFGKEQNRLTANDIDRMYNEANGVSALPAPFNNVVAGYRF